MLVCYNLTVNKQGAAHEQYSQYYLNDLTKPTVIHLSIQRDYRNETCLDGGDSTMTARLVNHLQMVEPLNCIARQHIQFSGGQLGYFYLTSLPVAVSPVSALAVICATIACVVVPLVTSNTRLTESGVMLENCEYADCENLIIATVGSKRKQ